MSPKVSVDRLRLAEFCRQNGVRRLAVFGSALRDDFRSDSDVDVLVEFEPGRTPGLRFFGMQEELSRLFDRTVDLHTPASLSRDFRSQVLSEAERDFPYLEPDDIKATLAYAARQADHAVLQQS